MSEEKNNIDDLFRSKLGDMEGDPMPSSWDKIAGALDQKPMESQKLTKIASIKPAFWYAAASVLVILSIWSLNKFVFNSSAPKEQVLSIQEKDAADKTITQIQKEQSIASDKQQNTTADNVAHDPSQQKTVTTVMETFVSQQEIRKIVLADGNIVTLHKESALQLSSDFPKTRTVSLIKGMAFFEIQTSDINNPFTVLCSNSKTVVTGTAFMIETDEDRTILHVKNGKVKFSNLNSTTNTIVSAGEKAQISAGQLSPNTTITSPNYLSWQNNKLIFDNTKLETVVSDVEQYYGVSIAIKNPEIKNCRFTGVFEKTSLDEILQVLSVSFNLKYDNQDRQYNMYGKGCK
jgi:hypothetical protein